MPQKLTLHYAGQPGEGYGWGCCNKNLKRALGEHFELTNGDADVCFMPLADHAFNPATPARGKVNFAYTFFESPLGSEAVANAARYDIVFCGSTWCLDRLRELGVPNGRVLIQGVDRSVFKPRPKHKTKRFIVFSGGKFEWRKGQDLVIAGFREFARKHPEGHLVCAWFNPWFNGLARTMLQSPHIELKATGRNQDEFFANLLIENGLRSDQFTILPQLPQVILAAQMANSDVGLFPNRCEGGTNLVLLEYLSCGRPAVANLLTGHADLKGAAITPIAAVEGRYHWAEQTPEAVTAALESAFTNPPNNPCPEWTWENAARTVVESLLVHQHYT